MKPFLLQPLSAASPSLFDLFVLPNCSLCFWKAGPILGLLLFVALHISYGTLPPELEWHSIFPSLFRDTVGLLRVWKNCLREKFFFDLKGKVFLFRAIYLSLSRHENKVLFCVHGLFCAWFNIAVKFHLCFTDYRKMYTLGGNLLCWRYVYCSSWETVFVLGS